MRISVSLFIIFTHLKLVPAISAWEIVHEVKHKVIELQNRSCYKSLHDAIENNAIDCAKLLLAKKADPNAKDEQSATPLQLAVFNKSQKATTLLLDSGADPNQVDPWGKTILELAIMREDAEIIGLLLLHGANKKQKNKGKQTPAQFAKSMDSSPEILDLLKSNQKSSS